jgi:phosphoribosyl 1,2-cyclic phosphate phosphodiesterase
MLTTSDNELIVIDTAPEFRLQMLRHRVRKLEHVLYTHCHADHVHGFDDLRAFYFGEARPVTCHVPSEHVAEFRQKFAYVFEETGYIGTKPQVDMVEVGTLPFLVAGVTVEPIRMSHGSVVTTGYRFGDFAYITDFKRLPEEVIERWQGQITVMVASGIRHGGHPTHSCIDETLALFDRLKVKKGVITHLSHEVDYDEESSRLPPDVVLAYDGLVLELGH